MRTLIGILYILGFSFGVSWTFYYIFHKRGLMSILGTFIFCIITILFNYITKKLVYEYVEPLEKKESLRNIEIILTKEENRNKDLIIEILKEKDSQFLKEYYEKKILKM